VVELNGDRIVLRPLTVDDVTVLAAIQAQPSVSRWWDQPDEEELCRKAEGKTDGPAFVIEVDGGVVGLIQYYEETDPMYRHAAIDLFLSDEVRGQGLGPDAVRTLARYLTGQRGHHRLVIDPAVENVAAIRAYEKVGFRPVGVMRRYERAPEGHWRDSLLMDVLADEL
jgi:aminoglycoside 6'-N-acetyltransferase